MAIVPMLRLTAIAPVAGQHELLMALQATGALHLVPFEVQGAVSEALATEQSAVRRCLDILARRKQVLVKAKRIRPAAQPLNATASAQLVAEIEAAHGRVTSQESRLAALTAERRLALPFGDATAADVHALAACGLHLSVYRLRKGHDKRPSLPADLAYAIVPFAPREHALLVCGFGTLPAIDLAPLLPPPRGLAAVDAERAICRRALEVAQTELDACLEGAPVLAARAIELADQQALDLARSRGFGDEALFAVRGWCPQRQAQGAKAAVLAAGGAVLLEAPSGQDQPPVLLQNNRVVRLFEPLLKAFQTPRYHEGDPTPYFAPFMAVFFGLCLGDAAYGLLLLLGATWLRHRLRATGERAQVFGLFQLLGATTIVIGLLLGVVFGVPLYKLAAFERLGLSPQTVPTFQLSDEPQSFFYFALGLGVLQCSVGLFIRMARQLRARQFQCFLGSLGWFGCMPGAAVWYAYKTPAVFYAALGLLVLFKEPTRHLAKRLGSGMFGLYEWGLGLFGDLMSYLRIFGLGLSSGIIAVVVNTIGGMLIGSGTFQGVVAGAIVLLVGHSFNFAMSVLGSTVHSARLQFLEFFGKFFEGGGERYAPLHKTTREGGSR